MRPLFSQQLPGLRLGWDATALTALWTCPQKYYRTMVQGIGSSSGSSKHLLFGKAFHAGLEELHNTRYIGEKEKWAAGFTEDEALRRAVVAALEVAGWREADGSWQRWLSTDKVKNARTLVRALVWYADDLARGQGGELLTATEDCEPMTEVYTEVGLGLAAVTGEEYWLCGNVDRYVQWDDDLWRLEVKTTKSDPGGKQFIESWWPNVQVKTYDLLDGLAGRECAGTLLEAHQVGVGFARWCRTPLRYAAEQRQQWKAEVVAKLREMEHWVQAGQQSCVYTGPENWLQAEAFPGNYTACHDYGDGCPLRFVCRQPWAEREAMVQSLWPKAEVWDPRRRK